MKYAKPIGTDAEDVVQQQEKQWYKLTKRKAAFPINYIIFKILTLSKSC